MFARVATESNIQEEHISLSLFWAHSSHSLHMYNSVIEETQEQHPVYSFYRPVDNVLIKFLFLTDWNYLLLQYTVAKNSRSLLLCAFWNSNSKSTNKIFLRLFSNFLSYRSWVVHSSKLQDFVTVLHSPHALIFKLHS